MLNGAITQQSEQKKDFVVTVKESSEHPSVQYIDAKKEAIEILFFPCSAVSIRIKTGELTRCTTVLVPVPALWGAMVFESYYNNKNNIQSEQHKTIPVEHEMHIGGGR